MRWTALFADLEAQVEQAERADLEAEVRDRTRREEALLRTVDRLVPATGSSITVDVLGHGAVAGRLREVGPDWLLVEEPGGSEVLLPLAAVVLLSGLGRRSRAPAEQGRLELRLDLRHALRGLVRSRSAVQVLLRNGSAVSGTLDRVGADHIEVAEHAGGEPRRAVAVTGVRLVPLHALSLVRSR